MVHVLVTARYRCNFVGLFNLNILNSIKIILNVCGLSTESRGNAGQTAWCCWLDGSKSAGAGSLVRLPGPHYQVDVADRRVACGAAAFVR